MRDLYIKLNSILPISSEVFSKLESAAQKRSYPKGSFVFKQGEVCEYFFFIEAGLVRSFYYFEEKEITLWFLKEGDIFTAFRSFITKSPSYEAVEALEDTRLIKIPYEVIHELFEQSHEFERLGRLIISYYWLKQEEHLYGLKFKSAIEKFESFAKDQPEVLKRAPLGYIASYLDMTQETLSRIRKK